MTIQVPQQQPMAVHRERPYRLFNPEDHMGGVRDEPSGGVRGEGERAGRGDVEQL